LLVRPISYGPVPVLEYVRALAPGAFSDSESGVASTLSFLTLPVLISYFTR